MTRLVAAFVLIVASSNPGFASTLQITDAWSPPGDKSADLPVYMTISNIGEADDLLRFKCPTVAHFTEKRTTDYGEGAPAVREVKSIAIATSGATELKPGGVHLSLLKIIGATKVGDTFSCEVSFRRAGRKTVDVRVMDAPSR
jgi:hypothetical protein